MFHCHISLFSSKQFPTLCRMPFELDDVLEMEAVGFLPKRSGLVFCSTWLSHLLISQTAD